MKINFSLKNLISELTAAIEANIITDVRGNIIPEAESFINIINLFEKLREENGFLYAIGNGASASMASHFAADVGKNACLRTQVFTDPSLITAIGNDISYEMVYAEPLMRHMNKTDILFAISSSGNSPNIIAGIQAARKSGGVVVTLSAMHPDNALRQMGDINIYVPAQTYGLAESAHAFLLHVITDLLVNNYQEKDK